MTISFTGVAGPSAWNTGNSDTLGAGTQWTTGGLLANVTAGKLYIAAISSYDAIGADFPTSITTINATLSWSLIYSSKWDTSDRRAVAVYCGIATGSGSNVTFRATYPNAQDQVQGPVNEVSGITDDGNNGQNLITEIVASINDPTLTFNSISSTYGYMIGAWLSQATPSAGPPDFKPLPSESGWTPMNGGFTTVIAGTGFTLPYSSCESYGKLGIANPFQGEWSYDGVPVSGNTITIGLEIRDTVLTTKTQNVDASIGVIEVANPAGEGLYAPADFQRINYYALEAVNNRKFNRESTNQVYLSNRKMYGNMKGRYATGDREYVGGLQDQHISFYADYRQVTTTPKDDGEGKFKKTIQFPSNLFDSEVLPAVFVTPGAERGAKRQVSSFILNPTSTSAETRILAFNETKFESDMDYFLSTLVVSSTNLTPANYNFMPVYWGSDDEKLQISSLAVNQMAENTDYQHHHAISGTLRNVDFLTKNPNPIIKYLNDEIVMYAKYEEFSPSNDLYNKNDSADSDEPKMFMAKFEFPRAGLFRPDIQPVVVCSVGAKIVAEPGTEIRVISHTLKEVRSSGFSIFFREWSRTSNFSTQDVYFINYIAIGDAVIDTDEERTGDGIL